MEDKELVKTLRHLDSGENQDDPYENFDLLALPTWWRRAVEEFEKAGLRPYRPPRFEDGKYKHEVIPELAHKYGVEIEFVGINVRYGDDWTIRIDGEPVSSVGHRRSTEGYSVFEIESEQVCSLVREFHKNESSTA